MKTTEKTTKNGGNGTGSGKNPPALTRDEVLRLSSQTIRQLHRRVSGGQRFKVQNGDSARLAMIRALSGLLQTYAGILRDHELADLEKRISDLEHEKECRCRQ
jgi:hypothetical protein